MSRIVNMLIVLTTLISFCVIADDTGFFIGSDFQFLTIDDSHNNDDTTTGLNFTLGYKFNPNVGIETGYTVTDKFVNDANFNHVDLDLVGYLPLSDVFSMYLGAGIAAYDSKASGKAKVGISYQLNENFSWLAGYTFYSKYDDWNASVNTFDIGFRYQFPQPKLTSNLDRNVHLASKLDNGQSNGKAVMFENKKLPPKVNELVCSKSKSKSKSKIKYTVKQDDWLIKISRRFNMDTVDFFQLNNSYISKLKDINRIEPGDIVWVYGIKDVCISGE